MLLGPHASNPVAQAVEPKSKSIIDHGPSAGSQKVDGIRKRFHRDPTPRACAPDPFSLQHREENPHKQNRRYADDREGANDRRDRRAGFPSNPSPPCQFARKGLVQKQRHEDPYQNDRRRCQGNESAHLHATLGNNLRLVVFERKTFRLKAVRHALGLAHLSRCGKLKPLLCGWLSGPKVQQDPKRSRRKAQCEPPLLLEEFR